MKASFQVSGSIVINIILSKLRGLGRGQRRAGGKSRLVAGKLGIQSEPSESGGRRGQAFHREILRGLSRERSSATKSLCAGRLPGQLRRERRAVRWRHPVLFEEKWGRRYRCFLVSPMDEDTRITPKVALEGSGKVFDGGGREQTHSLALSQEETERRSR